MKYAELQIGLQAWGVDDCEVELVYSDSSGPGEQRLAGDEPRLAAFDSAALRALIARPIEYGKALSDSLFTAPQVRAFFAQSVQSAAALRDDTDPEDLPGCPLQVRLHIGRRLATLHDLRWELLCDPLDGKFLATKETVVFSRYLSSPYYRPLPGRRPGERLRVVLAIADPEDATTWGLSRIDAKAEADRLRAAFDPEYYSITELINPGQVTLKGVASAAGDGCDILCLMCHGKLVGGSPWVWLVDEANKSSRTSGEAVVTQLMELMHQPQLVILVSCQSAGTGDGETRTADNGALAGLGPRLAEAGITAVIAMQGNVTARTAGAFLPEFFRSLAKDSAVDVATAKARRLPTVRDRDDFWMPVLFTRLQSGRIWAPQGLEGAGEDFRPWDSFLTHLEKGEATAILGYGLLEPLLGNREDVAAQWAQRYEYPLAPTRREDLTQVAQYLAVHENRLIRLVRTSPDEWSRCVVRRILDLGSRRLGVAGF